MEKKTFICGVFCYRTVQIGHALTENPLRLTKLKQVHLVVLSEKVNHMMYH